MDETEPSPSEQDVLERRFFIRGMAHAALILWPVIIFVSISYFMDPKLLRFSLVAGLAGAVLFAGFRAWWLKRAICIWRIGVPAEARVCESGSFSENRRKLRWEYDGRVHYAWFTGEPKEFPLGAHVPILIDPTRPNRYVIKVLITRLTE